mmetsp:Transcript_42000/g.57111  ORF Transcript_42000/g.57111 Transcript_42000/m.57111 type:complete len:207 (-) Transcript_42000:456-1076(-)
MIFLYLVSDSLIAYKSALLNCFGLYILNLYKLIMKDPRPFWISGEITSYNNCYFSFSCPSTSTYLLVFFWLYIIIMHRMKFTRNVKKITNIVLFTLIGVIWVWSVFFSLVNGLVFLYSSVIGSLYGFSYLVFCLNFDSSIHRYCEKTAFILRPSRARKFHLLFVCMALLVLATIIAVSSQFKWSMPQDWVQNFVLNNPTCANELYD